MAYKCPDCNTYFYGDFCPKCAKSAADCIEMSELEIEEDKKAAKKKEKAGGEGQAVCPKCGRVFEGLFCPFCGYGAEEAGIERLEDEEVAAQEEAFRQEDKRAEEELLKAFKNHAVQKEYTAWVCGHMEREQDTLKAYLIKNAAASKVQVFYEEKKNSKEIITKYKVMEDLKTSSLLSVEILTGRTHQIRAHLAFNGHAVIGDDKYGNREINKAFSMKYQALTASKLKFNLTGFLSYLNNKTFKVSPTWLENLNKDRI